MKEALKTLRWIAQSRKDLGRFPKEITGRVGIALLEAQRGFKPENAKPLQGFKGAGVLEVVESFDKNAYRAVYTVRFESAVYVLHCFQKKSKSGIATPHQDMELVRSRLKEAEKLDEEWKKEIQKANKK